MYNQYDYQKGARMSEPPEIITNKDLLYLQDAMSWELLASKKAYHYAQESNDPQVKQHLQHLADVHQQHYQTLLRHLQPQQQQQNISQYNQYTNQYNQFRN